MAQKRVVITGMGTVNPLAHNVKDTWPKILKGQSGIDTITKFDASTFTCQIAGEVKVIGDKKTDKLLGVHVVGVHATEIIHTAALAINRGMTVTELGSLIFGHPVISESIMEAAHDLHGMSVHLARKRK